MKIDFHVHTNYSPDSIIKLKDLKKKQKEIGGIVCLTEHNNIRSREKAKKLGIDFIPGEEVTTDIGHVLVYFVSYSIGEKLKAYEKKADFYEVYDLVREEGGVLGIAHPFDVWRRGILDNKKFADALKKADFIEVFNGKNKEIFDNMAFEYANKNKKLMSAGSDAHQITRVFDAYVEGEGKPKNREEMLEFLKKGKPEIIKRRSFFEKAYLKLSLLFKK